MAKQGIKVTGPELQAFMTDFEAKNTFATRSALWAAIEQTEWAKSRSPRPLTGQVAMLLAKKYKTVITTTMGKKGAVAGQQRPVGAGRRKRKVTPEIMQKIRAGLSKKHEPRLKRLEAGSLKAAIACKCLDCTNEQPKEIALCTCVGCPLFPFRPFQREKGLQDVSAS